MPNIAIIWDFDHTLSPEDSTTKVVEHLQGAGTGGRFWDYIKSLRGDQKNATWEHILAMDAPIWTYALSRLAFKEKIPLNKEFFINFILPQIKIYQNVIPFLDALKKLENFPEFKKLDLHIHHFVVSAGLKDLIEHVFPENLIRWTFGCRYTIIVDPKHKDEPESVPVFCMDETMKTRSIFEISKGAFENSKIDVNSKVEHSRLWASFKDMIYIGDGETDIPSLSLVRSKGGLGIAVYDPQKPKEDVKKRFHKMRFDKRTDLITPADYSLDGELFSYIKNRCVQIRQKYEAERID